MLLTTKLLAVLMLVIGGFFSRRKEAPVLASWDLETPLLHLSPLDPFKLRHACQHISIMAVTGGGKTTGPGATILRSYMAAGMGGFCTCTKPGDREFFEKIAGEAGRSESLLIVSPSELWRLNIFAYAAKGPNPVDQVVNVFTAIHENMKSGDRGHDKNGDFWDQSLQAFLRAGTDLALNATGTVDVPFLHKLFMSLPQNDEQVKSEEWQRSGALYQAIVAGDAKPKTPRQQSDFDLDCYFFLQEWLTYPIETRGSILATWRVMADVFLRGSFAELFCTSTNWTPEISHEGAIIVVDLPPKIYGQAGKFSTVGLKYLWEISAERRRVGANTRPVFMFIDEAHEFLTKYDQTFLATARSARCCAVLLSQNLSSYFAALGGESGRHQVESLLGNCSLKIFGPNGHEGTNKWASSLFGKHFSTRMNFSASRGNHDQHSGGGSEQLEDKVQPAEFTMLACGGPENNWCVECIVMQSGRTWQATGDTPLYVTFQQSI